MQEIIPLSEELQQLLMRLAIALGLGFLIGLEREYAKSVVDKEEHFAGVRTYTLIGLFGFLAAFLGQHYGAWAFLIGLIGFIAMVIASYVVSAQKSSFGITTELAAILTFLIGAVVFHGHVMLAVISTVVIAALLTLKLPLHKFVSTLTPQEIRAFIQFVIISAVMLPFLPDEPFGPYGVWNLKNIWTMVVLVAGISLAGYLLLKIMGKRGTLLAGIVGGLVSSTVVTLAFARRSKEQAGNSAVVSAVSIIAASSIMFPRVLLEATVINPALGLRLAWPVAFVTAVGLAAAYFTHKRNNPGLRQGSQQQEGQLPLNNPLNLRVALQFALIYMAVQWLVAFASERYGTQGIYAASLLSGATDMDAITLSMARKAQDAEQLMNAVVAILLASLSNTLVKYVIVLVVGDQALRRVASIGFGAMLVAVLICVALVRMLWG